MLIPGDHTLILADVVAAYYDDDAFSENMLINMQNFQPVIHLQNYILEKSQVHAFMQPCGSYTTEVRFQTKEDLDKRGVKRTRNTPDFGD